MKYRLYFCMLRLMDANLDRLSEGLRVLEDVARFILGDIRMTEILKRMRHELTFADHEFKNQLLGARDSAIDVGRNSPVEGTERKQLIDLITANAKRAQEALRVLEEFGKLPEIPFQMAERNFEQARFTLYEIEKEITLELSRRDKIERLDGIYVIIDVEALTRNNITQAVRQVTAGGAGAVQLRSKVQAKKELLELAGEMKRICADAGTLFIINDHVDIALAVNADGVHLGQGDLPVPVARGILSPDKIIGCTVRTVEQALRAQAEGADYIGVGAIYTSPTKPDAQVIGLTGLGEIRSAVSLPIVAIGGINEGNAGEVIAQGADSIAVVSAVLNSKNIETATRRLVEQVLIKE